MAPIASVSQGLNAASDFFSRNPPHRPTEMAFVADPSHDGVDLSHGDQSWLLTRSALVQLMT